MSKKETDFFMDDLIKLINYHAEENSLSMAEVVGCLEIQKLSLIQEALSE